MKTTAAALTVLMVIGVLAFLMFSRGPGPDAVPSADAVAARTMSPFCPGLTLDECPSSQAALLRARIRERVRDGNTNAQIDHWLVSNYGPSVLGRPASRASWLVPLVALSAGAALLTLGITRWRRSTVKATAALQEPAGSAELHAQFEQEFALYKQASDE